MLKNKALIPIFLIVAVDVLGMTLVLPFLPYYAEHLGASPLTVGLLLSSFAVSQFIASPILGRISDQVGRRPTLIFSQIGTFAGFIVLALANSLWLIFISRIIDGLTAGNLSIAQAYITDVTKPEERTKAFGLIGIAFGIGFLIGPALSGFLAQFGYHWPAYVAAGLSFTSILCTWYFLPEVPRHAGAEGSLGRISAITQYFVRKAPRKALTEFGAFAFSFSILISGMALYLERQFRFTATETGYLFAFSGVIGTIVQGGLIGILATKLGESKLALIGFVCMAAAYSVLGEIHTIPLLLTSVAVAGFGSAVVRPSLTSLVTRSVGKHEQGAVLGVSQSLTSVSQIFGPLLAGALIEHNHLSLYGLAAGFFALIGALMLLRSSQNEPAVTDGAGAPAEA